MKERFKALLRDAQVRGFALSVLVLAAVSIAFFYPDAFDGTTLQQSDIRQGIANGHEAAVYEAATGEKALWTNSLFGGMPTFQISPSYASNRWFSWIDSVYGLWLPAPSNLLFMMMFGFLILLFAMKMRWYYALLGAIAWGFSTYFIIIIGAGHIWKFVALSYIPPTIAGLMLAYRGRYLAGGALTAVMAMMQLNANHPQMSYYFFFVMAALVLAWLAEAVKEKRVRRWLTATAVCAAAGLLAVGANLPSIYNTYEYAKETKRSQSELTPVTDGGVPSGDAQQRATGGMPYEQIVGWSYGRTEMLSLLIPDIKGGASARPEDGKMAYMGLDKLPGAAAYAGTPAASMLPYLSQYFNDSEGTNGPVYVGALIFALFLLGCFILHGPVKQALVAVTVLSLLLALGRNFAALTDLMIYNFPLYNKFRAVESILVIAEFTMPLMAVMTLHKLLTTDGALHRYGKAACWTFGVCAAVCAAAALWPSLFGDAVTQSDYTVSQSIQQQVGDMAAQYGMSRAETDAAVYQYSLSNPANLTAIETLRHGLVKADAWRSLLFLVLGAAVVWAGCSRRIKAKWCVLSLTLLTLADLYGVDKRYVSHSSFTAAQAGEAAIAADDIDRAILADSDADYRVLDIPGFELPDRSYHHKMVGGYHAAKLNRYEDLIQRRLRPVLALGYYPELRDDSVAAGYPEAVREAASNYKVLDMLNTRYVITGEKDYPVMVNEHALGNAWFVDETVYVDGADAEMAALGYIEPARQAVADRRFASILGSTQPRSAGDTIYMTSYAPGRVEYHAESRNGGTAVFSEIYFPWGWRVTVDGEEVPHGRADYVLRALAIPAGVHEVAMAFDPRSLHVCSGVAYGCIALIYLLCAGSVINTLVRWRRD